MLERVKRKEYKSGDSAIIYGLGTSCRERGRELVLIQHESSIESIEKRNFLFSF